jgi:hypothetical protein
MPINLRYDRVKKILYATIQEQTNPNEFSNATKEMVSSNEYPPDVRVLWDARSAKLPLFDTRILMEFIEIRKRYPERGKAKLAIIVSNDFAFGITRMYEMLSSHLPQNIMVFKDFGQGEQWLQSVQS